MNSLEYFRLVELECKALIGAIEFHRSGVERKDDVLVRIRMVNSLLSKLLKDELKWEKKK